MNSHRKHILDLLKQVKPGQSIDISLRELQLGFPSIEYNGVTFNCADNVLESIAGSSYEWLYIQNYEKQCYTFIRREKPLTDGFTYVSPDRRHLVIQCADGTYKSKH